MPETFDAEHCPACGKPGLEKTFKPNGQEAFFCAAGCQWIGGRKEAEDLLALKTQVIELEEHIKELAKATLGDMMLFQKSKIPGENITEKQLTLDPMLAKITEHYLDQAIHSEPFAMDSPLITKGLEKAGIPVYDVPEDLQVGDSLSKEAQEKVDAALKEAQENLLADYKAAHPPLLLPAGDEAKPKAKVKGKPGGKA